MIAHKVKVVLGVVIAIFIVMAIPSFASAPSPDSVTGRVHAYYMKYDVSAQLYSLGYLDNFGQFVSDTSINYRTSEYIRLDINSPEIPRSFVAYNSNSQSVAFIYAISFYDSEYNYISDFGFSIDSAPVQFYSGVPEGAVYVRWTVVGAFSNPGAVSRYRMLFVPEYIDSVPDLSYFWSYPISLTVDSDGWFYVPYQAYTVNALYFDIDFYGTDPINISSVDTLLKFEIKNSFSTGGFWESMSLPDSTSFIGFNTYFTDQTGRHYNSVLPVSDLSESSLGLVNFSSDLSPASFSGFTLSFDCSYVSSDIRGRIWNLVLGSVEVDAALAVDDVLTQLSDLAEQLALPSPDLDTLLDVGSVLNNTNDTNASGIMSVIASDGGIITTMMVISVSITVLGYILFGKKEA